MNITDTRKQELIQHRRRFHSFPELKYEERETANYIAKHLQDLGFTFEKGIAETGIVCSLDSKIPGKTLLLRADMDALPIQEENQVSYASKNQGKMHACGHDGHTSILLGLASELKLRQKEIIPKGKLVLVFQPAEEGGGGADRMIAEGILEKYNVDATLALHVWNHVDIGKVGVVDGPMMASVDEFHITVKGVSGHGAMPQHTVDPIVVGAYIITSLQTLVSRNTDPLDSCVVTVGSFHAGDAFNVIPETATMKGTVRTYSKHLYEMIPTKLEKLARGVAESFGATIDFYYERVNKPTINNPKMADIVRRASRKILGENSVTEEEAKSMGGEDYSAFLDRVPGCYFFIGSRNPSKGFVNPHHSSKFDFDEDALANGLAVMIEASKIYLSEN
jgi:amidohydrolase